MDFVSTSSPPYPPPTPGGGYALRAVVVADSLDDLRGQVHGEVRLPLHLDASARQMYDLDQDYFRRLVYRLVLLEAATVEDLATWLDRDTLDGTGPSCTCLASYPPRGRSVTRCCVSGVRVRTCRGCEAWASTRSRPRSRVSALVAAGDHGFALAGGGTLWSRTAWWSGRRRTWTCSAPRRVLPELLPTACAVHWRAPGSASR